jgi:hypothetical protein
LVEPARVFLDGNILAKPVTRTLLIASGERSGFRAVWSLGALRQADAHLRPGMTPVSDLSTRFGWATTPAGAAPERFGKTDPGDRQILADAVAADVQYLVSDDVDDFDQGELAAAGIAAVAADLFLSHRITVPGYLEALGVLAAGRLRAPSTPEQIHSALGRQHPLLAAAMSDQFPGVAIAQPTHREAAAVYRGARCVRCGAILTGIAQPSRGLGPECQA